MRKLLLSTITVTAFLSGCTTLDDFIEMTPQQRAETVCRNAPQVKSLASQYETYADAAATARENLRRGYLLHRDCRWVRIPDGSHTATRDRDGVTLRTAAIFRSQSTARLKPRKKRKLQPQRLKPKKRTTTFTSRASNEPPDSCRRTPTIFTTTI